MSYCRVTGYVCCALCSGQLATVRPSSSLASIPATAIHSGTQRQRLRHGQATASRVPEVTAGPGIPVAGPAEASIIRSRPPAL